MSLINSAGTILGAATNPVSAVSTVLGIHFGASSDSKARSVLPQVVASANTGNLVAVAILDTRRTFGISAERAVWASGYQQVNPGILAGYLPVRDKVIATIPQSAQAGPIEAAAYVAQTRITVDSFKQVGGVSNILASPKATPVLGAIALVLLGVTIVAATASKRAMAAVAA
jgi:hypothetical protein